MVDFGERFLPYPPKVSDVRRNIISTQKNLGGIKSDVWVEHLDNIKGVFNFGTISEDFWYKLDDDCRRHANTSIGFVFPFSSFAFRCAHLDEHGAVGKIYICLRMLGKEDGSEHNVMLCVSHKQNGSMPVWGGTIRADSTPENFIKPEDFRSFHTLNGKEAHEEVSHIVLFPMFMFSFVLATKNIPKTTEAPSPKLQQKRAKEGLPPLPYTTNVNFNAYMIARNNTESGNTGTHASPRPHLRRAHLRTIMRGEETITIPVQQCMVNWDGGSPLMREEYKVKTTNLEK